MEWYLGICVNDLYFGGNTGSAGVELCACKKIVLFCDSEVFFLDWDLLMDASITTVCFLLVCKVYLQNSLRKKVEIS